MSVAYSDGRTAAFGYDRRGELVEMQDWNGTTAMEHDVLGRLTGVTDHNGRKTGFTYDAAGNRTGMAYETGTGSIRTVFGHGYQRLSQCTADGKTFFQSDIYGSPLFAADGQGTVRQYAERGIWGGLKAETEIPAGLEENLRFTKLPV